MSSPPDSDGNDAIMVGLDDVRDFNVDNILPLPPADIVEIRKWLQPTAYDLERSEYSRHRLLYLAGTGKWLTSTTTFQQWHQGDEDGLLWVKGIPGSGKSVLAASIINQLQKDGIPVIFFFFRQIIDANHQPVSALRDWLCQLLDYRNDEFLHALWWIWASGARLMSFSIPQIRLEEKLVDLDIAAYVQYKLRHSSIAPESWRVIEEAIPGRANGLFLYAKLSMDAFLEPGADANEVLKVLPADLNVMYNNLLHGHAIRSAVPEDLQHLVLQFVTHATRPLRILEIAEMAKSVQGPTADRSLKETKDLVRAACGPLLEILPDETVSVVHHSFTEFLKGFTRSSESDDTTYPISQPGSANKCLAIACLEYLRSGCLVDHQMKETTDKWEYVDPKDNDQRELKLLSLFLEYAAHNWYIHIRRAVLAGEDMALVYTMLDAFFAERRMFTGWRVMAWPKAVARGITALHVAAWAGLPGYAAHLLERGGIIEARDASENTALYWAATSGHHDVVQVLLANGADPNAEHKEGYKSLHMVAKKNHAAVAKPLLTAGIDPLTPKTKEKPGRRYMRRSNNHADQEPTRGNTALYAICGSGKIGGTVSPAGVDSLLQAGANVHVRSPTGKTALYYACDYHKADVVKMLLEAGADPTAEDDSGATPLHTEGKRDEELLPVLLGTGIVDINKAIGKSKRTPLLFRLQGFNMDRVLAFLEYKPDVNIADNSGSGPLHKVLAHYETHGSVIDALLSLGANPNAMNKEGNTPLHTMDGKHSPFISKLVDAGADLEARNHDGYTVFFKHANEGPFQTLIDLGARLDTRDSTSRTLLHRCCTNTDRLDYLISLGLDPLATDHQGNQPAFDGDCRYQQLQTDCYYETSEEENSLDYLLGVCKSVSSSDCHGVQPLHLAATISESHVLKLLSAGADMFKVTNEGMSVLHIAARTRQPNIVALFCSRLTALRAKDRIAFVNQQTTEGETALHYACRSGRPETVQELLEAGADSAILNSGDRSPFRACAQFEAEEQLWSGRRKITRTDYLHAAGVLISDHQRPFFDPPDRDENYGVQDTEHDTVRLDEILDLLVRHEALSPGKDCLQKTFDEAISNQYEYTLDALSRLQSRLPDVKPYNPYGLSYLICKGRLDATKQAFRDYDGHISTVFTGDYYAPFMTKLMFARQYDLFEEGAEKKFNVSKLSRSDASLMHRLVGWGYKELLERVCDKDAALRFDDHKWCQHAETEQKCAGGPTQPLLVTACDRNLPNMDVVEFLVEKVGVNLNAQFRKSSVWEGTKTAGGALHKLALGRSWWQVYKALPYLIKKGADFELRSEAGVTPLHAAMNPKHGPFRRDAVEILIECGADVNAVDDEGETCLSKAGNDLKMTRLLMDHGAHISAAAIFSAIAMGEIEILETLLSRGDYANLRRPEPVTPQKEDELKFNILDSEVSPLLFVAIPDMRSIKYNYNKPPSRSKDMDENLLDTRIITILLNHGADPFATYVGKLSCPGYDTEEPGSDLDEPDISHPQIEPQTHTIIHEILKSNHISGPFFQLPSLELERRDSSGCTLLLAASQSQNTLNTKVDFIEAGTTITKTIFQELIDRAANAMAQDNDGNTILHHLESFGADSEFFKTLKEVIIKNPGLLNQPNKKGETFFHRILISEDFDLIDDLLELGADPLQPDPNGNTALHHLAEHLNKSQAHFKRFLEAGVDINSRNNQGDTPLFKYIENGVVAPGSYWDDGSYEKEDELTEAIFDLFDKAGADFFAQNNAGSTLLHLLASKKVSDWRAAKSSHNVVRRFQILMDRGLDPLAEDARQRTSLDVAAVCGSDHIMKLFARKPME
ncbi:hypothetical protein N7449_002444 [Penicillium cf. viridicatum]|uniref:Nephrocystin 3-like N-terminal domain-containing protein n=1 Tax=Penicillium cf. viridicatum TaxID=2972119 RepID=A0A9W9MVF0_9EURO|nr:hypothetical protein N7449_002444 [Penicillium cf. viridicatum]